MDNLQQNVYSKEIFVGKSLFQNLLSAAEVACTAEGGRCQIHGQQDRDRGCCNSGRDMEVGGVNL